MRTLQATILFVLIILSIQSFAGGTHGNGSTMDSAQAVSPGFDFFTGGVGGGGVPDSAHPWLQTGSTSEIVLHLETRDDTVKFRYGQLVEDDWNIKDVEIGLDELMFDHPAHRAVEESEYLGDWMPIE